MAQPEEIADAHNGQGGVVGSRRLPFVDAAGPCKQRLQRLGWVGSGRRRFRERIVLRWRRDGLLQRLLVGRRGDWVLLERFVGKLVWRLVRDLLLRGFLLGRLVRGIVLQWIVLGWLVRRIIRWIVLGQLVRQLVGQRQRIPRPTG
jgi:hypothetical protein